MPASKSTWGLDFFHINTSYKAIRDPGLRTLLHALRFFHCLKLVLLSSLGGMASNGYILRALSSLILDFRVFELFLPVLAGSRASKNYVEHLIKMLLHDLYYHFVHH